MGLLAGIVAGTTIGLLLAAVLATQLFGFRVLAVQSGSMEPAFSAGDFVVSKPVSPDEVSEGDVIVFEATQGVSIAHRVINIVRFAFSVQDANGELQSRSVEHRFTTRGDANPINDGGFVTEDRLIGEVWFSVPGFGLGDSAFPVQLLLFGFAGAFGVVWIAWEIVSRRERRGTA